ncbi:hypothetical protein Fmac_020739 [Flemingia macrophylla]|uniref:GH3 C-terminal domain-containing protein n=1 Tax=Flemingia macrophylla TaxID=520843 RepID=A0ABD1LUU9_9FABA
MEKSFTDHGYVVSTKTNSIGPLELCVLEGGTFKKIFNTFIANGAALSQFKTPRCKNNHTIIYLHPLNSSIKELICAAKKANAESKIYIGGTKMQVNTPRFPKTNCNDIAIKIEVKGEESIGRKVDLHFLHTVRVVFLAIHFRIFTMIYESERIEFVTLQFDKLHKLESLLDAPNTKLRYLGDDMVLITDVTEKDINIWGQMEEKTRVWSAFNIIEKWNVEIYSGHRIACIRCSEVPLHQWNNECFMKLAGLIVSLIKVDEETGDFSIVEFARLLIRKISKNQILWCNKVLMNGSVKEIRMGEELSSNLYVCLCQLRCNVFMANSSKESVYACINHSSLSEFNPMKVSQWGKEVEQMHNENMEVGEFSNSYPTGNAQLEVDNLVQDMILKKAVVGVTMVRKVDIDVLGKEIRK